MVRKKDKIKESMNDTDYEHHLFKIILMFIANSFLYIESFLILYDKLSVPDDYIDLVYLVTCLIVDLIYSINRKVIFESKKLFCKKLCNKNKHHRINTFQTSGSYIGSSEFTSDI